MARSVEQILADIRAKTYDERARHIRGSYRFDVAGTGSYRLELDDGRIRFYDGSGPADCAVELGPEEFARVIEGEQNLLTAYMQGRARIEGDLALAKVFHGAIRVERRQGGEVHP